MHTSIACLRDVVRMFRASLAMMTLISCLATAVYAQGLVPGTGTKVTRVGDDFEDPEWTYIFNNPKSVQDVGGGSRSPWGRATNKRWHEGERGHPDVIRRVPTPPGGIEGSTGALFLATCDSGYRGNASGASGQDDLFMTVYERVGGYISVSQSPSVVVRVYVPPFEDWADRNGASFALRTTVRGARGRGESEAYWPGMFIKFASETDRRTEGDSAYLVIRSAERGNDYRGPEITPGWWTLGLSFTPDGRVHFYASPGVDDLTAEDHLASHYCYGFRCQKFREVFFDVFNDKAGRTWSTGWVIDDPTVYMAGRPVARGTNRSRR